MHTNSKTKYKYKKYQYQCNKQKINCTRARKKEASKSEQALNTLNQEAFSGYRSKFATIQAEL